ncbi:FG-GAP repeat domain-containing protein [Plantactinospora solaniradicis]|uniref:FG-GAP repeat domain-containing protein n=1 Tax=Plantactinospora solaniradicis TaxID=1723736 RepID=A0ABW1KGE4_9ACTN
MGSFNSASKIACNWGDYYGALVGAGDLNNDRDGDIVAVSRSGGFGSGCLYQWLGNGSGGFGSTTQIGCGWAPYQHGLTGIGDLNGDGNADLVSIHNDCLYRWYGNGGFGSTSTSSCGGWNDYDAHIAGMGDLDRDGIGDLLGYTYVGGDWCLYRWSGNGSGGLKGAVRLGCGGWGDYGLAR